MQAGGGIPSDIPGKGSGRKSHTPSGQSRTGAADLRASPPAAGPSSSREALQTAGYMNYWLAGGWLGCLLEFREPNQVKGQS